MQCERVPASLLLFNEKQEDHDWIMYVCSKLGGIAFACHQEGAYRIVLPRTNVGGCATIPVREVGSPNQCSLRAHIQVRKGRREEDAVVRRALRDGCFLRDRQDHCTSDLQPYLLHRCCPCDCRYPCGELTKHLNVLLPFT